MYTMLQRWKLILSNWNNCYFDEGDQDGAILDQESLLNIISHLRKNLDESKSSILEAHSIKEFLLEKYPGFKFENGTDEPASEDEIYIVASLLLFFVCVNSKDVDLKNAMCSKLSGDDQKTILKFSKCLMECPEITYREVQAAITEACGQDIAAMEPHKSVTETPPVLRSLHSEVRRLQAALDAERFDRTYLQEELGRKIVRIDKLLKEKEQYKLDILNLKAKISLNGVETECQNSDTVTDRTIKLTQQLQQLEEKLVETQEQLNDVVYERDVYKTKVEKLKQERDKYLSLSQQESTRVSQLSEELDTERRQSQSLRDVITELQEHNKLNRMDSSLLECDDPDASLQLLNNSAVCSEICANVVEVQLGEERAKIVVLKQQIQSLQDQVNELSNKIETDKKTFENTISEKDNIIFNIKHRINEEIEEKNNLKTYYDNEMTKLNNEINELEQRLKDNGNHSRSIIENKMEEIKVLQEEKLSLLVSMENETTKLNNAIHELQQQLETEKHNKSAMRDSYENHIMKLNEKVLNRNNELVELQDSVFAKGETIETLQIELKKEKEVKDEVINRNLELNNQIQQLQNELENKLAEINDLQMKLQSHYNIIDDMKVELGNVQLRASNLNDICKTLEDSREQLLNDVREREAKIEEATQQIEELTKQSNSQINKLTLDLDEKCATISSVQIQLKNEIDFKVELQNQLEQTTTHIQQLIEDKDLLQSQISKLKSVVAEKDKVINAMDLNIHEEKKLNDQANTKIQNLMQTISNNDKTITALNNKLESALNKLQNTIEKNQEDAEVANNKLLCETAEKESLQMQLKHFQEENVALEKMVALKCDDIKLMNIKFDELMLQINERDNHSKELDKVCKERDTFADKLNQEIENKNILEADYQDRLKHFENVSEQYNNEIKMLNEAVNERSEALILVQEKLNTETQNKIELTNRLYIEIKQLQNKIDEFESANDQLEQEMKEEIKKCENALEALEQENLQLQYTIEEDNSNHEILIKEKDVVIDKLEQNISENVKKYENLQSTFENYKLQVASNLKDKDSKITDLERKIDELKQTMNKMEEYIYELQQKLVDTEKNEIKIKTQLFEEKSLRDALETEKEREIQVLLSDKEKLITEKAVLTQEISQQKSNIKIAEDEKNVFLSEKIQIKELLSKNSGIIRDITVEKDTLSHQLVEERKAKETVENERDLLAVKYATLEERLQENERTKSELCQELNSLTTQKKELQQSYGDNISVIESLQKEEAKLKEQLSKEKVTQTYLIEENERICAVNNDLRLQLNKVISEKNTALAEKESFSISLATEKSARDELEKEKSKLLKDLNNYSDENEILRNIRNNLEDHIHTISSEIGELQEKVQMQYEDIQFYEQQRNEFKEQEDELHEEINFIRASWTEERSNRQDIEAEKEKLESKLMHTEQTLDVLKQQYQTINEELQSRVNQLEETKIELQLLSDERNELKKCSENYTTSISSKTKDIQTLQQENQSLRDELNNLKLQLDVKVHSLQEKLVDNENLTDKLKVSYECQIDNLNVMVTKLTNYLKDKTAELETLRKEKEGLTLIVEENKKAIKSLEEELRSEKHNIEKVISEFESERLVLKNMVTVTESVMEDQKNTFNDIVSEHLKAYEALQQEHEQLNKLNKELEMKLSSIEVLNAYLVSLLRQERANKDLVERESEGVREYLDEVIDDLKRERKCVAEGKGEREDLLKQLEKSRYDFETLKKSFEQLEQCNIALSNDIQTLNEHLSKVTNEKTESAIEVQDKLKVIQELKSQIDEALNELRATESEVKTLKVQLSTSLKEKTELESQIQNNIKYNNELKIKLDEAQKELKMSDNQLQLLNEEVSTISKEKAELESKIQEKVKSNEELKVKFDEVQKESQTIENELKTLKQLLLTVTREKTELESQIQDNINSTDKLDEALKRLQDTENELQTLKEQLSTVTKDKTELEYQIQDNIISNDELKVKLNKVLEESQTTDNELQTIKEQLLIVTKEKAELESQIQDNIKTNNELKVKLDGALMESRTTEKELQTLKDQFSAIIKEKTELESQVILNSKSNDEMRVNLDEAQKKLQTTESELQILKEELLTVTKEKTELESHIQEKGKSNNKLKVKLEEAIKESKDVVGEKNEYIDRLEEINNQNDIDNEMIVKLNIDLVKAVEESKTVINKLQHQIQNELDKNKKLCDVMELEKQSLISKCAILQEYQDKAEKVRQERENEINTLQKEINNFKSVIEHSDADSKAKDVLISKMSKEKDAIIVALSKELAEEKMVRDKCEKELENQKTVVNELKNNMEVRALRKENEQLIRAIGQQETFAALCHEKAAGEKYPQPERDHKVQNIDTHTDTITDLERIIHDKNRTITTLQSDITYLKTLMAESETKLMDVNKELELSKENCQQLSNQLKKIVYQKNEELSELKKQVNKMTATENRASQIIKVSAKYQAMILKRIAEIKSNTILKELTNFGNTNSNDNEIRRSLNAGTITMEDLENFLDTTDRHIKRCSEKQIALQKERDRLYEINKINESEIINLKKFLNELSLSFQTFSSVKNMYAQKLTRVVSVQRTVRREILNLEGHITDSAMCKLERGYAAVMQDLSECAMNLERWVERCISRTVSVEKIKQAFTSDLERSSLSSPSFQNAGLDIQLDELEKSFQKLLEEIAHAQRGEGARETQATTVMEVRAQYEDKLNRMKAKMKELLNEQMTMLKQKQRGEIALLERELQKTRDKMEEAKRGYENHIRELTKELWNVGEKYLVKNDEAEWLKRKQHSGSLMSLQHVHSSGLMPPQDLPSRPSDAHSLRSLPVNNNTNKREGRGLHMSDEEGEVFDNRWLKELSTPKRSPPPGQRLSELRWRNSLCPPHLKSSYPAETQFAPAIDEDDIKANSMGGASKQRKEVGITAYKKPGPPTPSKQAGRLSATDSELRESLRVENDPYPDRKTSTPARIRAFLSFKRHDNEGTPRARRLSNIFRKK